MRCLAAAGVEKVRTIREEVMKSGWGRGGLSAMCLMLRRCANGFPRQSRSSSETKLFSRFFSSLAVSDVVTAKPSEFIDQLLVIKRFAQ